MEPSEDKYRSERVQRERDGLRLCTRSGRPGADPGVTEGLILMSIR